MLSSFRQPIYDILSKKNPEESSGEKQDYNQRLDFWKKDNT